ncbi:MAG: LysM peptidoglycan-binding domain-containing protein [Deltaproteobacteria bacterium]|nr:LysM peptidoglycan-binding domain-containing protein [Deltaproteobacteria bacterium]
MRLPTLVSTVFLLLALGASSTASAQRVLHRVRIGETWGSLSRHYYGTRAHAKLLGLFNGQPATVGNYVRIPTSWTYIASRRSTLRALARKLLGNKRREKPLRAFNPHIGKRGRVAKDAKLLIPFRVPHTVRSGETYQSLAQAYYGDPNRAPLIREYNMVSGTAPSPGSTLEIPIGRIRITSAVLHELTNQRLLGVGHDQRRVDREALREANALLRRAQYWRVPLDLIRLLTRQIPSDTYVAEVFKLLAISYVALDQPALAALAFEEALLRQPSLRLNPVADSPKVIRAFVAAQQARKAKAQ